MTEQEAIKELESSKHIEQHMIHKDIPLIKALEMAIEALEKQIPKKANYRECACCGGDVGVYQVPFCQCCGQALKWGEDE